MDIRHEILLNEGLLRSVTAIYCKEFGISRFSLQSPDEVALQALAANGVLTPDFKLQDYRFGYTCYEYYRQTIEPDYFDRLLLKESVDRKYILDLCCGGGATIHTLLQHRPQVIYGVDSDEYQMELLHSFYSKLESRGTKVVTKVDDAHTIPLDDQSVDFVICRVALQYLNEEQALRDMKRVLQPQGKLFLLVHGLGYIYDYLFTRKGVFRKQLLSFILQKRDRYSTSAQNGRSRAHVLTIRRVKSILTALGFVNIQLYTDREMMSLGWFPVYFAIVAERKNVSIGEKQ
ncbi:class I SAM-dependent methyltransferase [Paenibacillus sp. UNC451MF]|uniref:class I SAM-dependent methyltransferase n=1 Tax=Paenibacillus sp. UNC451MF TaxID=1449063 RepID=UPI00048AE9AA|nr:class I SAM-dependent methyltransferase [Paenibacillus sp. UNC451MF]